MFYSVVSRLIIAQPQIISVTPLSNSVVRYEKFEVIVGLTASFSNPYDFDQVNLQGIFTSPTGKIYTVDGFYFQDFTMQQPDVLIPAGSPQWRIRFSPNETGSWQYQVKVIDQQGSATSSPMQFQCTTSSHKGFVKKAGNHLVYDNGQRFIGIGTNLAWCEWSSGFTIYQQWITSLKNQGGNFTKITLAPWIFGIEWEAGNLGNYTSRQNRAWALDWVFNQLSANGVYCKLHVLIHDELRTDSNPGWNQNPYKSTNGGPCVNPQDFFTHSTAKKFFKQKLRYIIARWGYSPYLHSWEIMSEVDNTGFYSSQTSQVVAWLNEMTDFIRQTDVYKREITSGFAWPQNEPDYWSNPKTGFTQLHMYDFIADLEMKIYNYARYYRNRYQKPHLTGEFAIGHDPAVIQQSDPAGIAFLNVIWSSVFSGNIGTALSWWWDNYLYPNGFFSYFQPLSSMINQIGITDTLWYHELPLTSSPVHETLEIFPDFPSTTQKAPSAFFTIHPSGAMNPTVMDLGQHLFGTLYPSLRNPPTFSVQYQKPGKFRVRTGSTAVLSKIKIRLNGVTLINTTASANTTYSIDVPAGNHLIDVDNSGTGILKIDKYIFENYQPQLRAFTMRKADRVAGWVQNINYNWKRIQQSGPPPAVNDATIYLTGLVPGMYSITWYNGNAQPQSTQLLFSSSGELSLSAPSVLWHGTFDAKFYAPFQIDFTASPVSGVAPLTVQFTDLSTYTNSGPFSWMWSFGDGTFSFQQNPVKTYTSPGTYSVSLKITQGPYNHTVTKTNFITVEQPVIADFVGLPTVVLPGQSVQFTDLSTGGPTSWFWDFGDGTTSTVQHPQKSFTQPGYYTISLTVYKGNQSNTKIRSNYIQVLVPLVADFTSSTTLELTGVSIQFTDLSTGTPTSWLWDFGNGTTSVLKNPSVIYTQPGSYTVSLKVANAYQQNTVIKPGYITILAPLVPDFKADTTFAWAGDPVQFTDLTTGNPATWNWNFGDGNSSTLQHPVHVYLSEGYYTVSLTVTNVLQSVTVTKNNYIYIRERLIADFKADTTLVVHGNPVQFTDLTTGYPTSWQWFFGDGFASQLRHPSHIFKAPGQYTVTLRAKRDQYTSTKVRQNYITVLPKLIAGFTANKQLALVDEEIQFTDQSYGNPSSWFWDFGNYSNSIEQHPKKAYSDPGIYTVKLTVTNQYQKDSVIKLNYITIIEPLIANFTSSTVTARLGQVVHFYDLTTGGPTSWKWIFSTGDTIYTQNPSLAFWQPGYVTVTLVVQNQYLQHSLTRNDYLFIEPPAFQQVIPLSKGWNGISCYLQPLNPSPWVIFAPVLDRLLFAYNEQGVFWPQMNINTLGNWNTSYGLIVKMAEEGQIYLSGYEAVTTPFVLNQGWNLFPVHSLCNQSATILPQTLQEKFHMMKSVAGTEIFWPEQGINTLEVLTPGKAFLIKIKESTLYFFPGCQE